MLHDPYLFETPSYRPELPTPQGVPPGRPAPAAPLKEAIVGKLRAKYPDLFDLSDDELLNGAHKVAIEDRQLAPNSTVDDLLKHYARNGIVIKTGEMGRTGPTVSSKQLNVPVINPEAVPSEATYSTLVEMHWPELADLDPAEVLHGVHREQLKNGKLAEGTTFDQFLKDLVGTSEATAKGVPGKTIKQLAVGLTEPFLAPTEAVIGALAAGAEETPEAQAARTNVAAALGRGAGAFVTLPLFAKMGIPALPGMKVAQSAKELIFHQIAVNAKAMGIYNALTTMGDVAPEVASGDESVIRALDRVGIAFGLGALTGAVLGPTLGAGEHVARIAANNAIAAGLAKQELAQLQQKAVQTFINDFKPEWVGSRFSDVLDPALPDVEIAQKIVSQLGPIADPTTPHYQTVVDAVTQKVGEYRALQEKSAAGLGAKVYPELPTVAGPEEVPVIAQPVGVPLSPEGGIAPEPTVLPGPLGEQIAPFVPPAGVKPVKGLEGIPEPTAAAPEPIVPEAIPTTPGPIEPAPGLVGPGVGVPVIEPHAPEAVQGPIGVPALEFTPPGKVRRLTGLQGPAAAIGREVQPEVIAPAEAAAQKIRGLGLAPFPGSPIRRIGNVEIQISTNPSSRGIVLDNIMSLNPGKGEATQVLKQITAVADEHNVPVELQAIPYERPEGGRIPLVKLVEWYKKHGFESVDEGNGWNSLRRVSIAKNPVQSELALKLAEDGPALAARVKGVESTDAVKAAGNVLPGKRIVPGSLGEQIEKQLDLFAKTADERLTKKLGRLNVGFDPSNITDMAIIGAAQMFKLGMRSKRLFTEAMTKLYGKVIEPYIDEVHGLALKILKRSISRGPTAKQLTHLLSLAESGKHGMNWYEGTATWAARTFGDDSDMLLRFLAATSADNQNEAGASMALKAYHQWKMGMPFDGMRSTSMVGNLERAARGEQFGGDKIDSYYRALRGDQDAVVLDRWMMRALGFKQAGTAGTSHHAFGDLQYRLFSEVIRDLSAQEGMSPRQFQAAVWGGTRVAALHGRFAEGGARAASRVGSAYPLETLIENRLGGLTPLQWIERNQLRFETLRNISQGLKTAREQGGYSYDPFTYEADKTPGYVVTLANEVIPKNLLYSNALVDFRKQFATQIGMSAFGDMLRGGQHLNVGVWNMGEAKPGHFSLDLNIVLPENMREQAMALGLKNRQFAVGHIDPTGNYTELKTGYDPKVHGPQDVAPPVLRAAAGVMKHPAERAAWFDKANIRVGGMLDQLGSTSPPAQVEANGSVSLAAGALQYMVEHPAEAITHASAVLNKTPAEVKQLIDAGHFKPMTDAGVAGAVFVTRDGTVWQYVDPTKPSYNTTKLIGSLKVPTKRVALLDQLRGMEVLRGHDVIEQYRGEVGQARFAMPEPIAGEKVAQLTTLMTKTGGKIVPLSALNEKSTGLIADSYWLLPNGRLIRSYFTHGRHADMMFIPKLHNYTSENGAGAKVQTLLNQGVIRIQASGTAIGIDVSAKITPTQRSLLQTALKTHPDWSAQISNNDGTVVSIFRDYDGAKPHHFLAAASQERR
jgi:hypothetical protein